MFSTLLVVTGLAVWQRENIEAKVLAEVYDRETLSDRLDQVRQENQEQLEQKGVTVPALTQKQMDRLLRGKLTEEKALSKLDLDQYSSDDSAADALNHCVAELYRYEARLYAQLGEIRQNAINTLHSYPKSERTRSLKHDIKMDAVSACYALEVEADNQVSAIIAEYRVKVADLGGDPEDVDSLWGVYCSEKKSVKAYYFNLLQSKEDKSQ